MVHLLLIVGLQGGGDIFADVGLFRWLCGFVLVAPAQQHTRYDGRRDPQSISWREGPTKERSNNNQNPITSREPKKMA